LALHFCVLVGAIGAWGALNVGVLRVASCVGPALGARVLRQALFHATLSVLCGVGLMPMQLRFRVPLLPSSGLLLAALICAPASAQNEFRDDGFLSAPSASSAAQRSLVDPEVTIIETDTEVVYEYRVKGQLYMVKVEPIVGPPFFLVDTNGDGILDVQDQRPPDLAVPQWLLFSW
jgi:hypothetical protein